MSGMTQEPENDHNLIRTMITASLILLAVMVICGWIFGSPRFAAGIVCGGILALGNMFWLKRSIEQAMGMDPRQAGRFAMFRYLVRLAVLSGFFYLFIVKIGIDIIGLIAGLSVLVIVIMGFSLYRAARTGG